MAQVLSRSTASLAVRETGTTFWAASTSVTPKRAANRQQDRTSAPVQPSSAGRGCLEGSPELDRYISQIACLSSDPGRSKEEDAVESFGPCQLRREFADVVGRCDHEHVAFVIRHPGQ